jgi:hypothetical protein
MRIRSTKPEFWRSKLIASVSWDARLVLKALESYVDDNGVGEDDVNVLVGDCFLHDLIREPSRTLARVSEAISELHRAGLVWRYTSDERNLLYISFWESVQRIDKAQAGRNPRPDGTSDYKDSIIRESVATPREESLLLAPGTGEQGNRGTGEQRNRGTDTSAPAALASAFDEAWSHWPKKVERKKSLEQFKVAVRRHPDLVAAIVRFGDAYSVAVEKQFVPALNVWLSHERWTDELPQPRTTTRTATRGEENLAFLATLADNTTHPKEITQ